MEIPFLITLLMILIVSFILTVIVGFLLVSVLGTTFILMCSAFYIYRHKQERRRTVNVNKTDVLNRIREPLVSGLDNPWKGKYIANSGIAAVYLRVAVNEAWSEKREKGRCLLSIYWTIRSLPIGIAMVPWFLFAYGAQSK